MIKAEVKGIIEAHEDKALRKLVSQTSEQRAAIQRAYLEDTYGAATIEAVRKELNAAQSIAQGGTELSSAPIYGNSIINTLRSSTAKTGSYEAFISYLMLHLSNEIEELKELNTTYSYQRKALVDNYKALYGMLKNTKAAEAYDYIVNTIGMDPKLTNYEAPKKYELANLAIDKSKLGVD